MTNQKDFFLPFMGGGNRNGCWFCPSVRIKDLARFKLAHPDLWNELKILSRTPNLCSYGFKYGMTVEEVDRQISMQAAQMRLEDLEG